jgi:uncharacterized membrane protein
MRVCECLHQVRSGGARKDKEPTPQKIQRNAVDTICGWAIIVPIALIVLLKVILKIPTLVGRGTVFCFETTALLAFGVAWLVKGETFLKDAVPQPSTTMTTDGQAMIVQPGHD